MFGNPTAGDTNLEVWLDQLRQAESATSRGAIMHRNLREDANVCAANQQDLRKFVPDQPMPREPDEAARQYEIFLEQLHRGGHPFRQPENAGNRLPAVPFPRLARSVAGDAFLTHNFFPTNKRKVPRYHRAKPAVKAKVRLRELAHKGIRIADLRGTIGKSVVFAASANVIDR
ncbi:MAG: hypothetical protein NTY19_43250 [Planctomycetota bacterium]|nr:hypothetical protein [Planctomycetota bacterium]